MEKLDEKSVFVKVSSGMDWISKPFMIGTFIENDIKKSAAKMETNLHRVFDWFVFAGLKAISDPFTEIEMSTDPWLVTSVKLLLKQTLD